MLLCSHTQLQLHKGVRNKMYLGYDIKNGVKYARICSSRREGKKVISTQKNLGKVLDEKRGIYQNRERGIFTYDITSDTYGTVDPSFVLELAGKGAKEKLILDFGDSYFLDAFIRKSGLEPSIMALGYENSDTLKAMVHYYVLYNSNTCYAVPWWDGNYARILYPDADLDSRRINDMLFSIGDEGIYRKFFKEYSKLLAKREEGTDIIIDSTGCHGSINAPLADIGAEMRLIYVLQQETALSLYMCYAPENVVDVSTLTNTIHELQANSIQVKFAILDTAYLTDGSVEELFENKVSFISELKEESQLYKDVLSKHLSTLEAKENLVSYNSKYLYIKRVECEIGEGHKAYAYLCQDLVMGETEHAKLFDEVEKVLMHGQEVFESMGDHGIFVLISSRPIETEKVLGIYYTQEQVYNLSKNCTSKFPFGVQSEQTLRGHLLLSFIATAITKMIEIEIKGSSVSLIDIFGILRNQKCLVFDDYVEPQTSVQRANDIYKVMKLQVPHRITIHHKAQ